MVADALHRFGDGEVEFVSSEEGTRDADEVRIGVGVEEGFEGVLDVVHGRTMHAVRALQKSYFELFFERLFASVTEPLRPGPPAPFRGERADSR